MTEHEAKKERTVATCFRRWPHAPQFPASSAPCARRSEVVDVIGLIGAVTGERSAAGNSHDPRLCFQV
jgi:hypothetical protein